MVLGTRRLYLYPHSALKVIPAVYLGPGLAVWLFGRPGLHIGASGLIYGLAIYILRSGIIRRDTRAVSTSMLVFSIRDISLGLAAKPNEYFLGDPFNSSTYCA